MFFHVKSVVCSIVLLLAVMCALMAGIIIGQLGSREVTYKIEFSKGDHATQ